MRIITNTAIALDGRIALEPAEAIAMGSTEDRRVMSVLRNQADAILVGGNTFRSTPVPLLPKAEHLHVPLRTDPIWNVVVSRRMDFTLSRRFLGEPRIRPLFLTSCQTVPADFPAELVLGPQPLTPQWIVGELAARNVQTLLIEAGGNLIFQFLKADLVDDLYVTLCPKLIGRVDAPTLADGDGFGGDAFKHLKLRDFRVKKDEVYLHYSPITARTAPSSATETV